MTDIPATAPPVRGVIHGLYLAVAVFFFVFLFIYYWTGLGGPTLLAIDLVPVTFILFTLDELRRGAFYPRLPAAANYAIATIYIAVALAVAVYMHVNYYEIGTVRAGFWSTPDLVMGGLMALLVMEYARKRYMPLFILNIVLILYSVYGWIVPGMFHHPGLSWRRIDSAMSVEWTTGVYSNLPQLALTLIGSFILVLSVMRAYGCVDSILRAASRVAARSPHALPQAAVLGSAGVASVSGSGAANAITTGSATIPAMIGAGMPRVTAAAIETAASLGGQLMPPIMGISAFLMAEFLGESYFDVVARGYAPALVYFVGVATSVYLLSSRYRTRLDAVEAERLTWNDWVNLAIFAAVVGGLIGLMAVLYLPPMFAALYVFLAVLATVIAAQLIAMSLSGKWSLRAFVSPLERFVDTFSGMTADLTLLLATLSIMTGALIITGVPTKIGGLLIATAGVNIVAMVLLAFFFGALLGTGLPPAPTYILTALVIAPPMIRAGIDPWVVHFFAFFIAVWGELTPPTSVVAAVTAKIANTSFILVLGRSIQICISLFVLMAGVFVHPALVLEPGLAQFGAMVLLMIATIGISFSFQARFSDSRGVDLALRLLLGAASLLVILSTNLPVAIAGCGAVAIFAAYWFLRRQRAAGSYDGVRSRS